MRNWEREFRRRFPTVRQKDEIVPYIRKLLRQAANQKGMTGMIVITDLDGTLCDIEHRLHLIQGEEKDWDTFSKECINDPCILPVAEAIRAMKLAGHTIWAWTGRSAIAADETKTWLMQNDVPVDMILMRPVDCFIPDHQLKKEWLEWHESYGVNHLQILGVFEDRDSVVKMWRDKGYLVFQPALGDF